MRDWLSSYLSYTSDQESPELFHFWCGLGILSSTIGRNIFVTKTYGDWSKLYSNLYIVLVSPSGRCRKGGALGIAERVLAEAGVKLYMEAITKRALTQTLSDQIVLVNKVPTGESKIVICSDELEVFLGKEALMTGLFTLLTRLFDCPDKWQYKTATQGEDYLYNTCINILGGTVPIWFNTLPREVMETGFLARVVIVAQSETPRKNPGVRRNEEKLVLARERKGKLVEFLVKLKEIRREVVLSESAIEFYENWYLEREGPSDERLGSFYEREHDLVLKVAMLLSASSGELFRSNVISSQRIKDAIMIIERVKETMLMAYSGVGDTLAAKLSQKILDQIREQGGEAGHSYLFNKNWYHCRDKDEFARLMEGLEERGVIKKMIAKSGKKSYKLVRREGR